MTPTRTAARRPARRARPSRIDIRLTAQVAAAGCAAKLGPGDLRRALRALAAPKRDPRVLVDGETLDDAGVYAWGRGEALVQTTDFFTPILDDPYDFGRVAATNALSDVYAMGGRPITALALLGVPDLGITDEVVRAILQGGLDAMTEAGASVLGGHSIRDPELKFGYAVTGVVRRRDVLRNSGARPGDRIVLTKPLGTGILSTALKRGVLPGALLRRLTRSMTTLNRAAAEAAVRHGARAATDVTGFSLLGHASQLADASGVTLRLRPQPSWLLPGALAFAEQDVMPGGLGRNRAFYGAFVDAGPVAGALLDALYDPQTSGGLLVALPSRRAAGFVAALRRARVPVIEAGEAVARGPHAVVLEQ